MAPDTLSFRKALPEDAEELNALRLAAIQDTTEGNLQIVELNQAFDWKLKDSLDRIKNFISDHRRYVEIAEQGNRVCGYLILHKNEVERLFVHPESQRKGIGSALLKQAEERALEHQNRMELPPYVKLDSFVTSRIFYEKRGYVATWSRKFDLDHSCIYTYWMLKNLKGEPIRPSNEQMSLEVARYHIDQCDRAILELIMKRFSITEWVGEFKAQQGLQAYDEEREMRQRNSLGGFADILAMPEWMVQVLFGILREESRLNHYGIRQSSHFNKK